MTVFRRLAACLMMALLTVTGQQITVARASGPGVMEMVLCTGGGLVTVLLDADGNPTGPPHICPDATLAFLPDVLLPRPVARRIAVRHLVSAPLAAPQTARAALRLPPARGPPLSV